MYEDSNFSTSSPAYFPFSPQTFVPFDWHLLHFPLSQAPGDHHSTLYESDYFRFLIKVESCSICSFVSGLLNLAWCPPSPSMLSQRAGFSYFLRMNNIPLHVYATFSLSSHPSMDTWVVSILWLLRLMLQWTWTCWYLFEILISFLLDIYPKVGLLDQMIVCCFFFLIVFFLNKFTYFLFIYFWLHWVFIAARAFSSCREQGLLFVVVRRLLLQSTGSRHVCFSSCGSRAPVVAAHGL